MNSNGRKHVGHAVLNVIVFWGLLAAAGHAMSKDKPESVCHGTPESGRLENGWELPRSGVNFQPYSSLGSAFGRTYVHSSVYRVVTEAYAELAKSRPTTRFVYGETGKESGGRFKPHRTHQNGLSVDFMVPVKDQAGRSVPLPASPLNKFGYGIEFSSTGEWDGLTIDFDAMAGHILALERAAKKHGIGVRRVIFDNQLRSLLFAEGRGAKLQQLAFAKFKPWVRHDEHYHVDFEIQCRK